MMVNSFSEIQVRKNNMEKDSRHTDMYSHIRNEMKISGTFMVRQTLIMFVEGCEDALSGNEQVIYMGALEPKKLNKPPPYRMGWDYGMDLKSRFQWQAKTLVNETKALK